MAKPRVFVSSTFYDLKHIRSSLDNFISSLGYEPILSEKGDIPYSHDFALDKSCYREVENCDIFVMIIGGRYGSEISDTREEGERDFFDQYISVTKKEFQTAMAQSKPSFILIESSVASEYLTYKQNVGNENITYAHVDSVNIFKTIDEIKSLNFNNPIKNFDKFSDIEEWLKNQWAGLFREQLRRQSNQKELANLSSQVDSLSQINTTLKNYLESLIQKINPDNAANLILAETTRLKEEDFLRNNGFFLGALMHFGIKVDEFKQALLSTETYDEFVDYLSKRYPIDENSLLGHGSRIGPIEDINEARRFLGKNDFNIRAITEDLLSSSSMDANASARARARARAKARALVRIQAELAAGKVAKGSGEESDQ